MSFFDGSGGKERNVSLRGKSGKREDQKATLERTRKERAKRLRAREEDKGARAIQLLYHSKNKLTESKNNERRVWDEAFSAVKWETGDLLILQVFRGINFFFKQTSEDLSRLVRFNSHLLSPHENTFLQSLMHALPPHSSGKQSLQDLNAACWVQRLFAYTQINISVAQTLLIKSKFDPFQSLTADEKKMALKSSLGLIFTVTNQTYYSSESLSLHTDLLNRLFGRLCELCGALLETRARAVTKLENDHHFNLSMQLLTRLVSVISNPSDDSTSSSHFHDIVIHFFTLPRLKHLLASSPPVMTALTTALAPTLTAILTCNVDDLGRCHVSCEEKYGATSLVWVLGNVLECFGVTSHLQSLPMDGMHLYIQALDRLLTHAHHNAFAGALTRPLKRSRASILPQAESDSESDEGQPAAEDVAMTTPDDEFTAPKTPIKRQLATLFSSNHLHILCTRSCQPCDVEMEEMNQETSRTKEAITTSDVTVESVLFDVPLCRLALTILTKWPSMDFRLLSVMSSCGMPAMLWSRLRGSSLLTAYGSKSCRLTRWTPQGPHLIDAPLALQFVSLLSLFCSSMSRMLVMVEDTDLREIFPPSELAEMAGRLRDIAMRIFWDRTAAVSPHQTVVLRDSLSRLLGQLRARDARQPFCKPEDWIMSSINPTRFAAELMSESLQFGEHVPDGAGRAHDILRRLPIVIAFENRVKMFRNHLSQEKAKYQADAWSAGADYIFEDGMAKLDHLGPLLKHRVRVEFQDEPGIDGGGLFKEFLTELTRKAFSEMYGLYKTTPSGEVYPHPQSLQLAGDDHLEKFTFLGRIVGKAVYEGILVNVPFAQFFFAKLLGKFVDLHDLPSLDPELHRHLVSLRHKPAEYYESLSLNFAISDQSGGFTTERELFPGGSMQDVTATNVEAYIYLVANYRLNVQIKAQSDAFLKGFTELIDPDWIHMFDQGELGMLLGGAFGGYSVQDFRAHVSYDGAYSPTHPAIEWFWEIVEEMSARERGDLLQFITSVPRAPLLGFRELQPPITIRSVPEVDHLPTASTCFNQLKLPLYATKSDMKGKLLTAISTGNVGFALS